MQSNTTLPQTAVLKMKNFHIIEPILICHCFNKKLNILNLTKLLLFHSSCIGFHKIVGVDDTASAPCICSQTSSIRTPLEIENILPQFSHHQIYQAILL